MHVPLMIQDLESLFSYPCHGGIHAELTIDLESSRSIVHIYEY
jgi:hypothetical protein